jgi:hypothetical protein
MITRICTLVTVLVLLLASSLSVVSATEPELEQCLGGSSPSFRLRGLVKHKMTFTLTKLEDYTPSKVVVSFFSGSQGLVTKTYIGVLLSDLLNDAEIILDSAHKNDSLRKYLEFTATVCYQVIVALAEILPNFGGQQAIIAYADGEGHELTTEGMARLVLVNEKAGGRLIQNITSIVVRSAP